MTREDILRAFLKNELFEENNHLKKEEAEEYRWFTVSNNKLIEIIKLAIDGEMAGESSNITEKKINKFLNQ
jgi:hypothetical protein